VPRSFNLQMGFRVDALRVDAGPVTTIAVLVMVYSMAYMAP